MKVTVYNMEAKPSSEIAVPKEISEAKWNPDLVHQVVVSMRANQRAGTAHTKGRGEVRGGGRKPWRQKGTGRARHGSWRSPIWVGGGVTHGPSAEKAYTQKINKKMQKKALYTVLAKKLKDNEVVIIDSFEFSEAKTKHAAALFNKFAAASVVEKQKSVVVLPERADQALIRALRNLPMASVKEARNLNALDAVEHAYLLFTKKAFHGIV